jgi:hypothetical protein
MLIIMLIAPCLLRSLLTRLEVVAVAGPSSPFGTYAGNSRTDLHRAMCAENSTPQERKREGEVIAAANAAAAISRWRRKRIAGYVRAV